MTPEQEARGAELFAEGKSEREVASALGVGNGSAHRLKLRLEAEAAEAGPGPLELTELRPLPLRLLPEETAVHEAEAILAATASDAEPAPEPDPDEGVDERHAAATAALADAQGHVDRLRAELTECERLRRECLAARRSTLAAHERRELAEFDLEAAGEALGAAQAALAEAGAAVAARDERRRLAAEQARRDEAAELGTELAPQVAAALRAAVTGDGTVKQLTELAGQLVHAEKVSGRSWSDVVLPPVLPGPVDDWQRAVVNLWQAARAGDTAACQALLPKCAPWQDRDRDEFAQMHADAQRRLDEGREQARQNMLRNRPQGGPVVLQPLPNPLPGAQHSARTGW